MKQGIDTEKIKEPTIFEDAITTGVVSAIDTEKHKIIPFKKTDGRIAFKVYGDVESTLEKIYSNASVGSLDVIRAIKLVRSMIFSLRGDSK